MKSKTRTRRGPNPIDDLLRTINQLLGWHQHPRNGKIARLPAPNRALINQWLDDGFTYRSIIEKLQTVRPPLPYPISEMNLSNWFKGGYKDWTNESQEKTASQAPTPSSALVSTTPITLEQLPLTSGETHLKTPTKA